MVFSVVNVNENPGSLFFGDCQTTFFICSSCDEFMWFNVSSLSDHPASFISGFEYQRADFISGSSSHGDLYIPPFILSIAFLGFIWDLKLGHI